MEITIQLVHKLRLRTDAPIMQCKRALEEANGDINHAEILLRKKITVNPCRETSEGGVFTYTHTGNKVAAILELRCETPFVANTDVFKNLAKDILLQITATNPNDQTLLEQKFIKDETLTISDLINVVSTKTGENIKIQRFTRYELPQPFYHR